MREGLKDRIKKETETPERVQGEVLPPSMLAGELPEGLSEKISDCIYDFCTYESKPPIEDLRKVGTPVWAACCMYIGNTLFKKTKILHDTDRERREGGIRYDYNKLDIMIDIWLYYTSIFGKSPLVYIWCYFCGLSIDFMDAPPRESSESLTSAHSRIFQKLRKIQESGLASVISDGSKNPTGAIAILNHWHGWNQNQIVIQTDTQKALTAASLPLLGQNQEFSGQIAQKQMFGQERTQAEKAPQSPQNKDSRKFNNQLFAKD